MTAFKLTDLPDDGKVPALGYAPGAEPAGWRSHSHENRRHDRARDLRLARLFISLQKTRTWDWAFVQSGAMVTTDRELRRYSK